MADESNVKRLEEYRAIGVKRIVFHVNQSVAEAEFFPLSVFDHAGALLSGEEGEGAPEVSRARDTEAPPALNVPPAMARILQKGSVS